MVLPKPCKNLVSLNTWTMLSGMSIPAGTIACLKNKPYTQTTWHPQMVQKQYMCWSGHVPWFQHHVYMQLLFEYAHPTWKQQKIVCPQIGTWSWLKSKCGHLLLIGAHWSHPKSCHMTAKTNPVMSSIRWQLTTFKLLFMTLVDEVSCMGLPPQLIWLKTWKRELHWHSLTVWG
jgi:hypothetical protein